jgi:outer membrane protein assembly factor BamB
MACGVAAGTAAAADWPQWRGPTRDNKATDFKVPATWPKELKKGWTAEVGLGVASPVLAGDKVYAIGRNEKTNEEVVTCLDANTGKPVWSKKYAAEFKPTADGTFPGPRATPAVGEGMLVTFGVNGTVTCFNATTGEQVWQKETGRPPMFHTSCSPLIADGLAIIYVGGDPGGALTAFELKTGHEKWKYTGEATKYGSPILVTIGGTKQVVTLGGKALVGVAFADGKMLWKTPFDTNYNAGTPVVDGDTVYVSSPGGGRGGPGGTVMYKIEKDGDKFTATEKWRKLISTTNYNTPLLKDGLLYAVTTGGGGGGRGGAPGAGGGGGGRGGAGGAGGGGQRGGGMGRDREETAGNGTLTCLDAKTGDTKWTLDTPVGNCGGVFDAGSQLIALTNKSELIAFKPSGEKFEEVAKVKVADTPTWALPILTGNKVIVKDLNSVTLWTVE